MHACTPGTVLHGTGDNQCSPFECQRLAGFVCCSAATRLHASVLQVGSFPNWDIWAEWNGKYRDDVRRFLKGDAGEAARACVRACCATCTHTRLDAGAEMMRRRQSRRARSAVRKERLVRSGQQLHSFVSQRPAAPAATAMDPCMSATRACHRTCFPACHSSLLPCIT